jgi:hypothetical protein
MGKCEDVPSGPGTPEERVALAVAAIVALADKHRLHGVGGDEITAAARGIVIGLCMLAKQLGDGHQSATVAHILGAAMVLAAAPQPNSRLALQGSIAYLERMRDELYPIDPGTLS